MHPVIQTDIVYPLEHILEVSLIRLRWAHAIVGLLSLVWAIREYVLYKQIVSNIPLRTNVNEPIVTEWCHRNNLILLDYHVTPYQEAPEIDNKLFFFT